MVMNFTVSIFLKILSIMQSVHYYHLFSIFVQLPNISLFFFNLLVCQILLVFLTPACFASGTPDLLTILLVFHVQVEVVLHSSVLVGFPFQCFVHTDDLVSVGIHLLRLPTPRAVHTCVDAYDF